VRPPPPPKKKKKKKEEKRKKFVLDFTLSWQVKWGQDRFVFCAFSFFLELITIIFFFPSTWLLDPIIHTIYFKTI
jgi:hypothetical protein